MSKINVRSPYFIYDNSTGTGGIPYMCYCKIRYIQEIQYIYISSSIHFRFSAIDGSVTFEISELVRDYIENTFDGDYTNSAKWVNYQVTSITLHAQIQLQLLPLPYLMAMGILRMVQTHRKLKQSSIQYNYLQDLAYRIL